MKYEASLNRVAGLKKTIDKILERLERTNDAGTGEYLDNTKAVLKNMSEDLDKFEGLIKGERKPTVGVFGCPSRGKSTLLNVLLGVNMLPMNGKAGTTRFGIELSHKDADMFSLTIKYNNKSPEIYQEELTEDDVADILKYRSDPVSTTKIEVEGPFRSYLGKDIVFIDTPGVELDAGEDNSTDDSSLEHDFKGDTQRALAILSSVDVVIFCMINKFKEKKDAVFYDKAILGRYKPINVITAGDKRDDDQTNNDIKKVVQTDYHLIKSKTVVVSSKEAFEKINEKIEKIEKADEKNAAEPIKIKANGKDIAELVETEFTGENLEEFKGLKDMILKKVRITDEAIKARLTRFEELYETIMKDAREKGYDLGDISTEVKEELKKYAGIVTGMFSGIRLGKLNSKTENNK
jgi:GTPase Era involved in 16S rRNA processing